MSVVPTKNIDANHTGAGTGTEIQLVRLHAHTPNRRWKPAQFHVRKHRIPSLQLVRSCGLTVWCLYLSLALSALECRQQLRDVGGPR
jgi:hypothetical protein